jgi:Leucine-rich repeat (LRR) protein
MKHIFRLLICIMTVVLMNQCEKNESISNVKIPDDNFLKALIELGIDTDGDGSISYAEAEKVTDLNVIYKGIMDMKGIEEFVNLESLSCQVNKLTALDISKNVLLKFLGCSDNQLQRLDI